MKRAFFENGLIHLAHLTRWAANAALLAMMLIVCGNVLLRFLGRPIWGSFEIVGFLGTIVISFALVHTTAEKSHLAVEMIVSRLPGRIRNTLALVNPFLSLAMLLLIAWQCARYGMRLWRSGEISPTLGIPTYPFLFGIAFSFTAASLVLAVQILNALIRRDES